MEHQFKLEQFIRPKKTSLQHLQINKKHQADENDESDEADENQVISLPSNYDSKNEAEVNSPSETTFTWKYLNFSGEAKVHSLEKKSKKKCIKYKTERDFDTKSDKNSSRKIIYIDLTNDDEEDYKNPPDNKYRSAISEKPKKMLVSCNNQENPNIPCTITSTNKLKRKLSTPNDGFLKDKNDSGVVTAIKPFKKSKIENDENRSPLLQRKPPQRSTSNKKGTSNATPLKVKNEYETAPRKTKTRKPLIKFGFLASLDFKIKKELCDPEALYYRENFESKKDDLLQKLFGMYNKKVFESKLEVDFKWYNRLRTSPGRCHCFELPGKRYCKIELNDKILATADRLRCTLIRELCHAAAWIIDGKQGHKDTWQKWARKANNIFPDLPVITADLKYSDRIGYKYTYKCDVCNDELLTHSKSKKLDRCCSVCNGPITLYLNHKDKKGNVQLVPIRKPNTFIKFVSENYKFFKKPNVTHIEVMKLLGKEYASLHGKDKK